MQKYTLEQVQELLSNNSKFYYYIFEQPHAARQDEIDMSVSICDTIYFILLKEDGKELKAVLDNYRYVEYSGRYYPVVVKEHAKYMQVDKKFLNTYIDTSVLQDDGSIDYTTFEEAVLDELNFGSLSVDI